MIAGRNPSTIIVKDQADQGSPVSLDFIVLIHGEFGL
jgi:hypothetical protein